MNHSPAERQDAARLTPDQMRPRLTCGAFTRSHPPARFGQPSNYSLSAGELAAHIRQLRLAGWQGWELRTRFTFGRAA